MAKFFGEIGFAVSQETAPGVWKDVIVERPYYGDVLRAGRDFEPADQVNGVLSVDNRLRILADPYIHENIMTMRYIKYKGKRYVASNVEVDPDAPRLTFRLGGLYRGNATTAPDPA